MRGIHPAAQTLDRLLTDTDERLVRNRVKTLGFSEQAAREWVEAQPIEYRLQCAAAHHRALEDLGPAGRPGDELDVAYHELTEDSREHDRLIRAASIASGHDYIATCDSLAEAAEFALGCEPDQVTLRQVLEGAGIELGEVKRELSRIAREDGEHDEAIELDRLDHDSNHVDVKLDGAGNVLYPAGTDIARLIVDPYEIERAYNRATKVDKSYTGEIEKFKKDYIEHARAGIDLASTLERWHGLRLAGLDRSAAELRRDRVEEQRRLDRAHQRETERQIAKLRKRL